MIASREIVMLHDLIENSCRVVGAITPQPTGQHMLFRSNACGKYLYFMLDIGAILWQRKAMTLLAQEDCAVATLSRLYVACQTILP
jgi:hypothetical protein